MQECSCLVENGSRFGVNTSKSFIASLNMSLLRMSDTRSCTDKVPSGQHFHYETGAESSRSNGAMY